MELEQYKQENEKLNARLNKAIEVFKQQKAQIDALTKENEELKGASQDDHVSPEKLNELATEKENLNKQLNEYELKLQNSEAAYEELRKKYAEVKSLSDDSIQAGTELGKENAELRAKIHQLESNSISQEDFDDEVKRLNQTISDCKKSYDERVEDISKLQMEVAKLEKDNDDLRQSTEQYKAAYEQQKKENKETEEQYNKVLTSYENDLNELKEKYDIVSKQYESKDQALKVLQQTYDEVFAEKNKLKEENTLLNTHLGEVEERYDKLNLQYDNLENEKLGLENDLLVVEEKYNELLETSETNSEYETHLIDTLSQIRDICDDIINPKPAPENELKQNFEEGKGIEIPKVKNSPAPHKLIKANDSLINQAPTILG